ncbi:MarR family winged helix-turn-helix transcriptional regulator [Methanobacterium sp. MBAC-LM]|jgi:DNA-binding MarR family transcriptional regulator|uniref:MarR family winged helix-turn-helix transcriptional regulator n=1 Tax=Methanobacterium sp. MBAC-LM TaxID=3412034 RepID=UPI00320D647C
MENIEGPEKYICFKLNKVRRKIHRYYESKLAPFNITPVQFYVLSALWDKDEIKFKDLARRLDMDGSTLTGILDRMEKRGFIKRKEDPDDRRSILVCLTNESKEIRPQMIEIAQDLDHEFRDKVPDEEFRTLLKVLDKL